MRASSEKIIGAVLFLAGLALGLMTLMGLAFTRGDATAGAPRTVFVGAALLLVAVFGGWLYQRGAKGDLRS